MIEAHKIYRAQIDGYANDGGVARIDGMAVFVKDALRGETADVLIEHIGHRAAWGRIETLLKPSPARVDLDCPYFPACGGCQLRHMSYEEELEIKRLRVEDAIQRIGGLNLPVKKIWGAPSPLRYRNKVQFPVSGRSIGYYQPRSHRVVDIEDCLLQPEQAASCRQAVAEWMSNFSVPSYDERTHTGLVRHLYLRFNQTGESLCCLVINGQKIPHEAELIGKLRAKVPGLVGVVLNCNKQKTNVILGPENQTLWGQDWLEESLLGLHFQLSVPSFFQINQAQTERLYSRAIEFAGLTGKEIVLDLYCGIGTISLCMAARAGKVIGAELVPQAIRDAEANAVRNHIQNASFLCGDAAAIADRLKKDGLRPDVIVVDPPRKGLAPDVPQILAGLQPERIVYVSCDPATLARDLARFQERHYQAVIAEAVDLFPRTRHVETVVLLSKLRAGHHIKVDLDLGETGL